MSTDAHQKVSTSHLERDAYLYVRQSSLRQVMHNTESTKRQYALRQRAVALGWPTARVHTIDSDLGRSGAAAADRDGFQHLVTKVAMGEVGIVLGLEVSRLARNNADWHRLIELAALSETLILDEDGIYDPAHFNDRLLLGLKGTMSEAELHVLKARLQGGILNKARRGELKMPLPIGLAYQADDTITLDLDQQIRQSLALLFTTFRKTGSAMAVVKRFTREGLKFPQRIRRGIGKGEVHWGEINHSRVLQILHNPRYAGAFVYGRTRTGRTAQLQITVRKVARENWPVLIPNAHVGYISWEEYERNQSTLHRNRTGFISGERGGMPREGSALLQGRVVCGLCGERMRVRYQRITATLAPYYQCTEASVRRAGKICQSIRGSHIDQAISELLLETVAPAALNVALAVQEEIADRVREADELRATQLEQARYEAELARRRYLKVDPDNRLVVDALEADWNERLRRLDALQQDHERQRDANQNLLAEDARERIMTLAQDFPRVWQNPRTEAIKRKRMVALLVEDVTLTKREEITVGVRFRGGKTQSFTLPLPLPMSRIRKTPAEVVSTLNQLLESYTDREAAQQLNELGHRNWQGQEFTAKKVSFVRRTYALKSRLERLRDRGFVTALELANQLDVSTTTIYKWGREGLLQRELYGNAKRCLYRLPKGKLIVKGQGCRRPRAPIVINAQSSTQETV
ncbi:MAG: recombinase family protein [Gammaproteobacteria bacterium]|nr:recombinase family protein [Gammaproteobacteria bacterium]